ncbi:hypothetical protein BDN70DRAFT_960987 [Pholiota conissans]|uniref:RING-type domain-containing protein n=1 Tax=Pholiota conissans TaxID=109636 RepID=A0A9P5YSP1_9AGAR|nr:hypothetical protein BDN70DRAFT_960987 [Pholiota conissans]
MECSICWENLEDKVCSLTCGHIFHRSCIEPLIYDTEYLSCPICRKRQKALFGSRTIREVFFTSPTRPSAPSSDVEIQDALDKAITENVIISHSLVRTRAQSARIRTQHLRAVQQRVAGAERESILQREVEKMKRARDSALEALADLRAQRDAWAEHARMAEETKDELQSAVARLEEMEREKDNILVPMLLVGPQWLSHLCQYKALNNYNFDFGFDFDFSEKGATTIDGGVDDLYIGWKTFMVRSWVQSVYEKAHLYKVRPGWV